MLRQYDKEVHPVGESIVRVHPVLVVLAFMKAGIGGAEIHCLCEILELGNLSLLFENKGRWQLRVK